MSAIEIQYTCRLCGIRRAIVPIRERGETEAIMEWMEMLRSAVGQDHQKRSPICVAAKIDDVLIPMTGRKWVGGPVVQ